MKKLSEERLVNKKYKLRTEMFYIQTVLLLLVVIFDFFTHGINYVITHPILPILFVMFLVQAVQDMEIAKDFEVKNGFKRSIISILCVDIIAIIIMLFNLEKHGVLLYIIVVLVGSIIGAGLAWFFSKKGSAN